MPQTNQGMKKKSKDKRKTKSSNLLMIFIKNTIKGRVKTRLAKTIGDEKALEVYKTLLQHTHHITQPINSTKQVHYTWHIEHDDIWEKEHYDKCLQIKGDLGSKMSEAFAEAFANEKAKVLIIGSDCADLTTKIINTAFEKLKKHDVVIGPAQDGGYYLLGMKAYYPSIFENIPWSTPAVLPSTLDRIQELEKNYFLLPMLSDIDHYEDLPKHFKTKLGLF